MNEREILIAGCGVDEAGDSKSIIKIETKFIYISEDKEIPESEITLDGPVLNIHRNFRFAMLDITFASSSDYDLVQVVEMLQKFSTAENSFTGESIPIVQVTFMPKELEGLYFGTGIHGSWVLVPSKVNSKADTVRFIFDTNEFHTYHITESAMEETLEKLLNNE